MSYLEEYYNYLTYELCLENNSVKSYIQDLKMFDLYLEKNKLDINDVTDETIFDFLLTIDDRKVSTKTHYITVFKSFFKFLYNKKYKDIDIASFLETPKKEERLVSYLTIDEVYQLVDASSNILEKLITLILFKTGIRVSELINIKSNDLNINDYSIKIHGKGNKERIVLFDNEIKDLLTIYLKENDIKDYLLINNHHNIDRFYVYNLLQELKMKTNIKKSIYPHILRHSFATYMLQNGTDLRLLQSMLGHSDIMTTTIYTHLLTEHLELCYNKYHPFGCKGEKKI